VILASSEPMIALASAPAWYDSTVWGFIAVPVAILAIVTAIWLGVRTPRRTLLRITYRRFPLLNTAAIFGESSKLSFTLSGHPLKNAHVCEATLTNHGKSDITEADFSLHQPIVLDFNGEVRGLLELTEEDDGLKPICVIKGNVVELPPQLLKSRQPYVVRALVEDPGDGFYYEDHLVNVDIKRASAYEAEEANIRRPIILMLGLIALCVPGFVLYVFSLAGGNASTGRLWYSVWCPTSVAMLAALEVARDAYYRVRHARRRGPVGDRIEHDD
jgi:hypothetical protein